LNRLNPTAVFLAATALVLVALFVPGPAGGGLLLVVAAAAAVLLAATWGRIHPVGRAVRLVVLALVLVLAVSRFT
jgi:hypothetical protein